MSEADEGAVSKSAKSLLAQVMSIRDAVAASVPKALRSTPRSIGFRIVALNAFILIPLVLLFAWMTLNYAWVKRELIEVQRFDVTSRLSAEIDLYISNQIGMLSGLAGSDDLIKGQMGDFKRHSTRLSQRPYVAGIWAFNRSGVTLIRSSESSSAPEPSRLPREIVEKVFAREPAVSEVMGLGSPHATITVAVPVVSGSRVTHGVAGQFYVAPLGKHFLGVGMQPNWVAAVIDKNGNYVARSLDPEQRLGHPARSELAAAARAESEIGTFENVTYEGLRAINSYRRSQLTGWTSVVAVPRTELEGPFKRALLFVILIGVLIVTATAFAASLLSARILEPIRSLRDSAIPGLIERRPQQERYHILELDEVRSVLKKALDEGAWLSALVESSGDAIMSVNLDGTIRTWNRGAKELFGFSADEVIGRPKEILVPAGEFERYEAVRRQVLNGDTVRSESLRKKRDGSLVHVSLSTAPIRGRDGRIVAISSIIHDISDRKSAEEHNRLLVRELAHRSKNQLAIIQSIAGQTARESCSLDEFLEKFVHRVQGLAASHDILSNNDWKSASLKPLVEAHMDVFGVKDRVCMDGPNITLTAPRAEAIGLALHELATNALKYGAFSAPNGSVAINWQKKVDEEGKAFLILDWAEQGGPAVANPKIKGFGSQVIERMVGRAVDGTSSLEYRPEGVHWHFECPLD